MSSDLTNRQVAVRGVYECTVASDVFEIHSDAYSEEFYSDDIKCVFAAGQEARIRSNEQQDHAAKRTQDSLQLLSNRPEEETKEAASFRVYWNFGAALVPQRDERVYAGDAMEGTIGRGTA
eukprot:1391546-Amorphochlora_amoeboformis.AAC.2